MRGAPAPGPVDGAAARRFFAPSRLWFALAFAAVIAAVGFVLRCAVNVPFWDEWEWVRLLQIVDRGQLTLDELLVHHNEHRIVIPRLVAIALAWLTSYDTVADCLFTVGHLAVLVGYAYATARRSFGFAFGTAPAWFVPVAWLLLSWRQVENLVWGFQIGLSLPLTFAFAALYHLESHLLRRRPLSLALSIAAATGASFSSAMGLLVWPAALVVLLLRSPGLRAVAGATASWIVAGTSVWLLYFAGYTSPAHHASVTEALRAPVQLVSFLLTLGGAWATGSSGVDSAGMVVGAVLLALIVACCVQLARRRALADQAAWLALATFCSLTLAMIAAGRSGQPSMAGRSAYTTYSLPLVATLVVLLAALARDGSVRVGRFALGATLLIVAGTALSYQIGAKIGNRERKARRALQTLLLDYRNRSDTDLAILYPVFGRVREGADFLAARHWSVFAGQPANASAHGERYYHWGDALRFGIGGTARPHLVAGWSLDEEGFTWNLGDSAIVRMQVAEQREPLRLELVHAMTNFRDGRSSSQRVIARVDGRAVGEATLTGGGQTTLDLATDPIPAGPFELELQFPDAFSGAANGGSGDRRVLGVAVSSLRLVARD